MSLANAILEVSKRLLGDWTTLGVLSPHVNARAVTAIRLVYFVSLVTAVRALSPLDFTPRWHEVAAAEALFDPLWTIMPLATVLTYDTLVLLSYSGYLISASLALWFYRYRLARVVAFLGILLFGALLGSFGKIDHNLHLLTLALFFFAVLPVGSLSSTPNAALLIAATQFAVLTTYASSGLFKVLGLVRQVLVGPVSALDPTALGLFVSRTSTVTGAPTMLQDLIIATPSLLWSVLLVGGYTLELVAIFAVFRPRFHRLLGLALIALHAGILATVGPDFTVQIMLVGVLFLFSPFVSSPESSPSL